MRSHAFAHDFKEKTVQQLEIARDKIAEQTREAGKEIDADAHRRPWVYIGVAALVSVFFGFFLGRKSK